MRVIFLGQGIYYLVTAVWPMVHMRSFLAVTGPKTDLWLVRTVGALILVISLPLIGSFFVAGGEFRLIELLSIGACLALATVDVYYVAKKVIAPIYLGDAVVEMGMLIAVLLSHA